MSKEETAKAKVAEEHRINVHDCARCGQNHLNLAFKKLTQPGERHTHWAMCPTVSEPIMLVVLDDDSDEAQAVKA